LGLSLPAQNDQQSWNDSCLSSPYGILGTLSWSRPVTGLLATTDAMDLQHRLPLELWIMVFQMLSKSSDSPPRNHVKNVRLTCRLFERLATPFLLSRICCAPLPIFLTTLTAVSLHPVLSKSVKEVVYICRQYRPDFETLLEYKEALRGAYPLLIKRDEYLSKEEKLDMETAFSRYRQHYNDQTAMENSGEVIARLCSALMRMPAIDKITISPNLDDHLDNDGYSKYALDSKYFLEPEPAYNEAFLLIARVLSHTGVRVRELNIETENAYYRHPTGVDGAVFRGMSHMDMSHCCNAFRGLREVKLAVHDSGVNGWMTGNLAKILSGATDLETLWICGSYSSSFLVSSKHILGTMVWSRLTCLKFSDADFDQGELLDILRRHSATLLDVQLSGIHLTGGSWKTLLEGMKSYLSLQAISIRFVTEENDGGEIIDIDIEEAALKKYLFGDGAHPLSDNIP
jgi:hypothetical protein